MSKYTSLEICLILETPIGITPYEREPVREARVWIGRRYHDLQAYYSHPWALLHAQEEWLEENVLARQLLVTRGDDVC